MSRLQTYYKDNVMPQLKDKFSYENVMEIPKITKITLNMGVGEAVGDKKVMDRALGDMTAIAGQKPIVNNARKSVASFKIRDGWPVGCKVTLRRERMYEFLDRLVNIAIPRIRDFRGLNRKSFDGRSNSPICCRANWCSRVSSILAKWVATPTTSSPSRAAARCRRWPCR